MEVAKNIITSPAQLQFTNQKKPQNGLEKF